MPRNYNNDDDDPDGEELDYGNGDGVAPVRRGRSDREYYEEPKSPRLRSPRPRSTPAASSSPKLPEGTPAAPLPRPPMSRQEYDMAREKLWRESGHWSRDYSYIDKSKPYPPTYNVYHGNALRVVVLPNGSMITYTGGAGAEKPVREEPAGYLKGVLLEQRLTLPPQCKEHGKIDWKQIKSYSYLNGTVEWRNAATNEVICRIPHYSGMTGRIVDAAMARLAARMAISPKE